MTDEQHVCNTEKPWLYCDDTGLLVSVCQCPVCTVIHMVDEEEQAESERVEHLKEEWHKRL